MIKRITAAALLLCMCLFFCACGEAQQSSLTPYEELYLQRAEELLAAGDRDTAIAALEEGISATGSEALKNRLNEIRGTDSAEGEASDSNVSDSSPSDLSTDAATSDLSSTDANSSQASSQAADDLPTATQQTPSDASSDAGTSENPADNSYAAYCGFYKTENYDDVEISDLGNGVLRFVKTGERGSLSGTLNAEDIVKNKGIVTLADEVGTSFDVIFEFSDGSVLMDGVSLIPFDLSAATLDFEGFFGGTNVTLENGDWYLTYRRNTCYPVLELSYGQSASVSCKILAPIDRNGYKTIPTYETNPNCIVFQLEDQDGLGGSLTGTFGEGSGGSISFVLQWEDEYSGRNIWVSLESKVQGVPSVSKCFYFD